MMCKFHKHTHNEATTVKQMNHIKINSYSISLCTFFFVSDNRLGNTAMLLVVDN